MALESKKRIESLIAAIKNKLHIYNANNLTLTEAVQATLDCYDSRYEVGKEDERESFWDVFQNYGELSNYYYAFSNTKWNNSNYNPLYDIRVSNGTTTGRYIFSASAVTDTKVSIYANDNNAAYCFADSELVTIRLFHVKETTTLSNTFAGCDKLVNVTMGGTIGQDISLSPCIKLSKASIESVINALSATATGKTATFSKTAKEAAFTADEWETLIATKPNWTISLV